MNGRVKKLSQYANDGPVSSCIEDVSLSILTQDIPEATKSIVDEATTRDLPSRESMVWRYGTLHRFPLILRFLWFQGARTAHWAHSVPGLISKLPRDVKSGRPFPTAAPCPLTGTFREG